MKWIQRVLWNIQRTQFCPQTDRQTDRPGETSIPLSTLLKRRVELLGSQLIFLGWYHFQALCCMEYRVILDHIITAHNCTYIVRYYINDYRNWGRISIRCWIHKRHPIPHPNGRAMGCFCLMSVTHVTDDSEVKTKNRKSVSFMFLFHINSLYKFYKPTSTWISSKIILFQSTIK